MVIIEYLQLVAVFSLPTVTHWASGTLMFILSRITCTISFHLMDFCCFNYKRAGDWLLWIPDTRYFKLFAVKGRGFES